MHRKFEDLPNEIFLDIFEYVDAMDLYRSFWNLNDRINLVLGSLKNRSATIEKNDFSFFKAFGSRIVHLKITAWHEIDLSQFKQLKSLIIRRPTRSQVVQIRPDLLPNLVVLSLSLTFDFWSSTQLAEDVFSNGFPSLRHADLGRVDIPLTTRWSLSPNLRSISVCSSEAIIVPLILASCPNLKSLQLQIIGEQQRLTLPSFRRNHPVDRFLFIDSYGALSFDEIDSLLTYMPNIRSISFTLVELSFVRLTEILSQRLKYLKKFQILIHEPPNDEQQIESNSTFSQTKVVKKNNAFHYFN